MTPTVYKSLALCLGLIILMTGCGPQFPEVIQAGGAVSINGEPLPNAVVKFIPLSEGLDGTHVAFGTTDDDGKFKLELRTGPGVYSGKCVVIVQDPDAPDAARALTGEAAGEWKKFKESLANRPIPKKYKSVALSPLNFEVGADKTEFNIDLER